jgi:hypothetical protein
MLKHLIPVACLLAGCPAPLAEQQSLAARVHKATVDCVATTVNPKKAKVCAQALLCQQTAKSAADALQAVNVARSTGDTDVAAEAKAAGLDVLADTACKQGGW